MAAEQFVINVPEQDQSVAPTGGRLQSSGNQNSPPIGQTERDTTYKPAAQVIVPGVTGGLLATGGLLLLFGEATFGGKPQANWTRIILILIHVLALPTVGYSFKALYFSTNMTINERCHEVRLSLILLMIIKILAVITFIVLMAKAYWASLA